jgi:hypothetical protein
MMRHLLQYLLVALPVLITVVLAAIFARSLWLSRRGVQELAGSLLLKAVRPRAKKLEAAGVVVLVVLCSIYILTAPGLQPRGAASGVAIVLPSEIVEEVDSIVMPYLAFFIYLAIVRWTYLEFRQRGVVCGVDFWPWESIRHWNWAGDGLALRLKVPLRINTYRIARDDKEAIQAILESHMSPTAHGTMEQ